MKQQARELADMIATGKTTGDMRETIVRSSHYVVCSTTPCNYGSNKFKLQVWGDP